MPDWDYDNGMLNKLQLSHTHSGSSSSAGSHRHGTIGDNPTTPSPPDYPQSVIDGLRSRFGWYSTSKGVGLRSPWDNDNGMLNMRPTHSHFTLPAAMAPLARIQTIPTALHKPLDPALAGTAQAKALAWGMKRLTVSGTMITACKHKQLLSRSHGTIGENPALNNADHKALNSRFGYYSTSQGVGMAVTLDYDNGMLNKRPRPFTFLHQVTSHRHGTIGEVYDQSYKEYRDLNTRFGYYTTSKGVGFFGVEYDYDNGMLNTSARAFTFKPWHHWR